MDGQNEDANLRDTGLPLLHTWPSVYAFILASFALIVLALYLFTRTLS